MFMRLPSALGVHVTKKAKAAGISLPKRTYRGDAGLDLRVIERVTVKPGRVARFPTGLVFNLPTHQGSRNWRVSLWILPRTGLAAKQGLYPMAWVVDSGYRPEDEDGLTLFLRNLERKTLEFAPGDRVAQGVLIPVWTPTLVEISADEIDETERGGRRLGSSGIK